MLKITITVYAVHLDAFFFSENIFGSSFNDLSDVGEFKGSPCVFFFLNL